MAMNLPRCNLMPTLPFSLVLHSHSCLGIPSGNPFGCAAETSGTQQVPFARGRMSRSDISPGFGITYREICCFLRIVSPRLSKASVAVPKSNSSNFPATLGSGTHSPLSNSSMIEALILYSKVKVHKLPS